MGRKLPRHVTRDSLTEPLSKSLGAGVGGFLPGSSLGGCLNTPAVVPPRDYSDHDCSGGNGHGRQSCGRGAILGEGGAVASEASPTAGKHLAALSLSLSATSVASRQAGRGLSWGLSLPASVLHTRHVLLVLKVFVFILKMKK